MTLKTLLPWMLSVSAIPIASAAGIWDVANDFSATQNPFQYAPGQYSPWTYGSITSFGGSLLLYALPSAYGGIDGWNSSGSLFDSPGVFHNSSGAPVNFGGYMYMNFATNEVGLSPGNGLGKDSVIRFTAPATGSYSVSATFSAMSYTTTDVHVLRNGLSLFNGTVDFYFSPLTTSFSTVTTLAQGDTLDFAVGYGCQASAGTGCMTDGNSYDLTGLAATITTQSSDARAPEPATWALAGLGALGLPILRKLRHRRR